jgi:hypothetical protein
MANWMFFALGALVLFNVFATIRVVRDTNLTVGQRAAQAGLVWVLPVLGSVLILNFLAADRLPFPAPAATLSDSNPGDETTLAPGPSVCGCPGGGGDGD